MDDTRCKCFVTLLLENFLLRYLTVGYPQSINQSINNYISVSLQPLAEGSTLFWGHISRATYAATAKPRGWGGGENPRHIWAFDFSEEFLVKTLGIGKWVKSDQMSSLFGNNFMNHC